MASYITKTVTKHLAQFLKNFSEENIGLQLFKGTCQLENIELNEKKFQNLLPPSLELTKLTCNKAILKISWTRLKHEPIIVQFDKFYILITEPKELIHSSALPTNTTTSTSTSTTPGQTSTPIDVGAQRSFTNDVIENITIKIQEVHITVNLLGVNQNDKNSNSNSNAFTFHLLVHDVTLQSTNGKWQVADLSELVEANIKRKKSGDHILYKELFMNSVSITLEKHQRTQQQQQQHQPNPQSQQSQQNKSASEVRVLDNLSLKIHVKIVRNATTFNMMAIHIDTLIDELHLSYMQVQWLSIVGGVNSFLSCLKRISPGGNIAHDKTDIEDSSTDTLDSIDEISDDIASEAGELVDEVPSTKKKDKKASKLIFSFNIDQWDIELLESQQERRQEKGFVLFGNNLCIRTLAEAEILKPIIKKINSKTNEPKPTPSTPTPTPTNTPQPQLTKSTSSLTSNQTSTQTLAPPKPISSLSTDKSNVEKAGQIPLLVQYSFSISVSNLIFKELQPSPAKHPTYTMLLYMWKSLAAGQSLISVKLTRRYLVYNEPLTIKEVIKNYWSSSFTTSEEEQKLASANGNLHNIYGLDIELKINPIQWVLDVDCLSRVLKFLNVHQHEPELKTVVPSSGLTIPNLAIHTVENNQPQTSEVRKRSNSITSDASSKKGSTFKSDKIALLDQNELADRIKIFVEVNDFIAIIPPYVAKILYNSNTCQLDRVLKLSVLYIKLDFVSAPPNPQKSDENIKEIDILALNEQSASATCTVRIKQLYADFCGDSSKTERSEKDLHILEPLDISLDIIAHQWWEKLKEITSTVTEVFGSSFFPHPRFEATLSFSPIRILTSMKLISKYILEFVSKENMDTWFPTQNSLALAHKHVTKTEEVSPIFSKIQSIIDMIIDIGVVLNLKFDNTLIDIIDDILDNATQQTHYVKLCWEYFETNIHLSHQAHFLKCFARALETEITEKFLHRPISIKLEPISESETSTGAIIKSARHFELELNHQLPIDSLDIHENNTPFIAVLRLLGFKGAITVMDNIKQKAASIFKFPPYFKKLLDFIEWEIEISNCDINICEEYKGHSGELSVPNIIRRAGILKSSGDKQALRYEAKKFDAMLKLIQHQFEVQLEEKNKKINEQKHQYEELETNLISTKMNAAESFSVKMDLEKRVQNMEKKLKETQLHATQHKQENERLLTLIDKSQKTGDRLAPIREYKNKVEELTLENGTQKEQLKLFREELKNLSVESMNQATELSNVKTTLKLRDDELQKHLQEIEEKEQKHQHEIALIKKTLVERERQIENLIMANAEFQEMLHDAPVIEDEIITEESTLTEGILLGEDPVLSKKRMMLNTLRKFKKNKRDEGLAIEPENSTTPREINDKPVSVDEETQQPKDGSMKKNFLAMKAKALSNVKEQLKDMKDSVKDMKDQMKEQIKKHKSKNESEEIVDDSKNKKSSAQLLSRVRNSFQVNESQTNK